MYGFNSLFPLINGAKTLNQLNIEVLNSVCFERKITMVSRSLRKKTNSNNERDRHATILNWKSNINTCQTLCWHALKFSCIDVHLIWLIIEKTSFVELLHYSFWYWHYIKSRDVFLVCTAWNKFVPQSLHFFFHHMKKFHANKKKS